MIKRLVGLLCRRWHLLTGVGFYHPGREQEYLAMLRPEGDNENLLRKQFDDMFKKGGPDEESE